MSCYRIAKLIAFHSEELYGGPYIELYNNWSKEGIVALQSLKGQVKNIGMQWLLSELAKCFMKLHFYRSVSNCFALKLQKRAHMQSGNCSSFLEF